MVVRSQILVTAIAFALAFTSISIAGVSQASGSEVKIENSSYYYQGYNGNSTFYLVTGLLDGCTTKCIWHSEDRVQALNDFSNQTVYHALLYGYCSLTNDNALLSNDGGDMFGYYLADNSSNAGYYINFPISFTQRYSYMNNDTPSLVNGCPAPDSSLKISLKQVDACNVTSNINSVGPIRSLYNGS